MIDRLTIPRPDDWHLHLRDGAALRDTVAASARHFGRVIVMPNLKPPVTTTAAALAYRQRILDALPPGARAFDPRMTLYLTDETGVDELARARASGVIDGVKLYPAGATTHSAAGVRDLAGRLPIFAAMAELGLPLLVHAEVVDADVDVFDRERVFLERELAPICAHVPGLRVVVEHITTSDGVDFVRAHDGVAATITAHHLLLNRNALLVGGVQPHHYCLPVLKRERHRQALVKAAKSGDPRFFLGTDSAPHARGAKEAACGCAGCYTAPHALALYAEAFDQVGALGRLEGFASHHGPWFYGHPVARETVTLVREACPVPATYALGDDVVVPLRAGGEVGWRVLDE